MMTNLSLKAITVVALMAGLGTMTANAQLGGLGNALKNKVKNEASKTKTAVAETAKEKAAAQVRNVVDGVRQDEEKFWSSDMGDCVRIVGQEGTLYEGNAKSSWEQLQEWKTDLPTMTMNSKTVIANALYYLYRMEEAADEQNFDNQELEYFTRSGEMYNFIENIVREAEGVKGQFRYNEYKDHYNAAYGKIWAKLWAGLPKKAAKAKEDRAKFAEGTYNQIEFEIGKSNEYSGKMKEWYLDWAYSAYNLNASFGYLLESDPRYDQVLADLKSAIAQTSEEFQARNPVKPAAQLRDEYKAEKEQLAKEEAERKAAREAEIAASMQPWPATKMGDAAFLNACLAAARAQFPEEDAKRVTILNSTWQIDRDGFGNIVRRRVSAWVDIKKDGRRYATNYGFAQDYMGGGKYGKTYFFGVGTRSGFFIK
ncbi:MAG TPA: hypothetical protein DDX40_04845 [Rikenellaceae bacterium]|nr:hypothetical protein [Rikenellaceae bacterium]